MAISVETAARNITKALGGRWAGGGGECRCPAHDDREPSLSVRAGEKRVLFWCFAGCSSSAVITALLRLGVNPFDHEQLRDRVERAEPARRHGGRDLGALARTIWSESQSASGTIAEWYLAGRGIAAVSKELRFNPRTAIGTGAELQRLPALLAPVRNDTGLVTIQRTFLDPQGTTRKPFNKPKRVLSDPLDGAIRLRPAGPVLGLAEGLEDAATALLWWDVPVWAAMGSKRYARLQIPDIVEHVVVFGQNNAASYAGFERAKPHLTQRDRTCELRTPQGHEDWNDAWRARLISDA